jgi:hypothetical protein
MDTNIEVKQASKGVYYAQISSKDIELDNNSMYYDIWSKIALNGLKIDDIELEFAVNPFNKKIKMGSDSYFKNEYVPSVYGINEDEVISRHEVREVIVDFREEYNADKKVLIDSAEYRLYVKDGNREYDVINYHPIEKAYLNNFFLIHTEDLIPNQYFVDIKVKIGREIKYYKEVLRFKVVSNITERYQ